MDAMRSSWVTWVCCDGFAETVVIGRPIKSRSLDGSQCQKRQAETLVWDLVDALRAAVGAYERIVKALLAT